MINLNLTNVEKSELIVAIEFRIRYLLKEIEQECNNGEMYGSSEFYSIRQKEIDNLRKILVTLEE